MAFWGMCSDLVLDLGDICETVSVVTVREEESFESCVVAELDQGVRLGVLEIGQGRRIKVKNHSIKGWISHKDRRLGQPLVTKVQPQLDSFLDDFNVGGDYEVMSNAMLRAAEAVHSMVISALPVGTQIKIVEIGTDNKRHAKVATPELGQEGWISLASNTGDVLVGTTMRLTICC
mmetsp:Transcript_31215/g.60303  ORF Transcript_31215/g.60303 Transcript_31215/m.60303 type:complete len:176 (+) Transcript_31215:28-555(+)